MSEEAKVLFANEAFYLAFRNRDFTAMDNLWSRSHDVACIHPGWPALFGREEVMDSWKGILQNEGAPQIFCREAEVFLFGEIAQVVCYETIGQGVLVATNVFSREKDGWLLVHHHAGPCNISPDAFEEEDAPPHLQ